jgi:hypothetical protein
MFCREYEAPASGFAAAFPRGLAVGIGISIGPMSPICPITVLHGGVLIKGRRVEVALRQRGERGSGARDEPPGGTLRERVEGSEK